jgi:hypothetical protein
MDMHKSLFGKLDNSPMKDHTEDVRTNKKNMN